MPRLGAAFTLRRRLVAGLLAVLAVVITGIGVAEVLVLRHALYQRSAQGLRTELQLLVASTPPPGAANPAGTPPAPASCSALGTATPPGPPGGPPRGAGPTLGPEGATVVAQILAQRGVASAVVGPAGDVLACATAARTGHQGSFSVPAAAVTRLAAQQDAGFVTVDADGQHLLAIAEPVGSDTAILVTDLADDDAAVEVVTLVTVLAGLGALALSALLFIALMRSALAPLRKIARTADAIAAGDLSQRAALARSPDEVGRLGSAFDAMVDRIQRALSERDELLRTLAARERAMRQFLADASHELRTPLTAIRGGAQVLRLGAAGNPADLAESLGHIQAQAERMSGLVADLLILSRHDSVGAGGGHRPLDLGDLIAAERPSWESLCVGHPLTVQTEAVWVSGDHDALGRLVTNLVDNAAKYAPVGTPLNIGVRRTGDGRARLEVVDHGPGVPAGERERVFERFYRGDPARARATGGSGLGLAIVASIAADHLGSARLEETPGGGTTVVIELPALPPSLDPTHRSGERPARGSPPGEPTGDGEQR